MGKEEKLVARLGAMKLASYLNDIARITYEKIQTGVEITKPKDLLEKDVTQGAVLVFIRYLLEVYALDVTKYVDDMNDEPKGGIDVTRN